MDCSIIIVNYNTQELLLACLESVFRTTQSRYQSEVIVVDNASADGSAEAVRHLYPQVTLLAQEKNLGFARANNQGIDLAKGRYILLLNPDTILQPDTLATMLDFMEQNSDIGASGCKVLLPDGSLDKACKRSIPTPLNAFYHYLGLPKIFPTNRKFGAYNLTFLPEDEVSEVGALVGAFMLVRRDVVNGVGALSEDYFMYGEDIDWCYRIKEAGWKIVYYPKAEIVHYKRASSKKVKLKTTYHFYKSMLIFYNKFYRSKYNALITVVTYVGVGFVFGLSMLKSIFPNRLGWDLSKKEEGILSDKKLTLDALD